MAPPLRHFATCLIFSLTLSLGLAGAQAQLESTQQPVRERLAPVEQQLLEVLQALASGNPGQALALADALAAHRGDHLLLNALREDLRAAQGAPAIEPLQQRWLAPPAAEGETASPAPESLLAHEAFQRWRHRDYAVPSALPFVLALDPSVRHLIVVETATSRLFLFRNDREGILRLERDFYASIGRRGAGKALEGDERTPLGVYFTLSRMDEEGLAERYGAHAFPLDYPNAWDRRAERTGRGIWIHGVPPHTYARPPLDSDGCVAMTNQDIQWMAKRLSPRRTPVVIAEEIPWAQISPSYASAQEVGALRERIQQWLDARAQGLAVAALATFYESAAMVPTVERPMEGELAVRRLTLIQDPTHPALVVASFGDGAGGWYRQYWRQLGADWRIAAERLRPPRR